MVDIFSFFLLDINNGFISAKFNQMKHVILWITEVIIKKMDITCIYTSTIITLMRAGPKVSGLTNFLR